MKTVYPKGFAWIDNEYVDISNAKISILDWGFLRSDATYDVVHVWNNRFFLIDNHINRFLNSTKKLRMPCKKSKSQIKKILANCVKKSGLKNAYVEIIQTRGMSPTFDRDPRKSVPRLIAFAVPFSWILKPDNFEKGLNITVTDIKRIPSDSIDPTIKNYHWLDLIAGMFEAYDRGGETGILVDGNNNILEGPGFNVFSLDNRGLHTPEKGVLKGITRESVINIANELQITLNLSPVNLQEFEASEEIFITSTAGGVMPVTKINNKKVAGGNVGDITRKIKNIYWERHKDPKWSSSVDEFL